jgi:hypothetical protein
MSAITPPPSAKQALPLSSAKKTQYNKNGNGICKATTENKCDKEYIGEVKDCGPTKHLREQHPKQWTSCKTLPLAIVTKSAP